MVKMYEARIDKQTEKAFLVTPLNFKHEGDLWIPKSQINDVFMVREWLQKQLNLDKELHLVLPAGVKEDNIPWIDGRSEDNGNGATVTNDEGGDLEEDFGSDMDDIGEAEGTGSKEPETAESKDEPEELQTVRILKAVPTFTGINGKSYTVKKGDVVTLPKTNAKLLCKKGVAKAETDEPKTTEKQERDINDILGDDERDKEFAEIEEELEAEEANKEKRSPLDDETEGKTANDGIWGERAKIEMKKIEKEQGKGNEDDKEEDTSAKISPQLASRIDKIATIHEHCIRRGRKTVQNVFGDVDLTTEEKTTQAREIGTTILIQLRYSDLDR